MLATIRKLRANNAITLLLVMLRNHPLPANLEFQWSAPD